MKHARPLLQARDVVVRFDGVIALDGVSFEIREGEILGLIGPNGAGKTTLFNCLSRLYTPTAGDVVLEGRSILPLPAHAMAALGVGRTFQNVALFPHLSVRDNVMIGGHCRTRGNFITDALKTPFSRKTEMQLQETAEELIAYLDLGAVADRPVADLPFGWRKRVELARALAARPKLLLLDEPAAGLNHDEVRALTDLIRKIRDERQLTVLLVEHHMGLVMAICEHIVALNFGKKIAEGTPQSIQQDAAVVAAYLGGEGP